MTSYSLEPAETLSPAAMTVLRRIYEEGFPPHQRVGFAAVTVRREPGELALALVGDGRPCGFAMLRPLMSTSWIYLRYFVVDESQRGQGLGGLLWEQLTVRLRDAGFTLLVWDVEDPHEPDSEPAAAALRLRRIRFYQRHGASLLPVTGYRAPHAAPESSGWSPMLLMTAPLSGRAAPPDSGWARAIVEAVYRFRWQLDPEQFPVFSLHAGDPARRPPTRGVKRAEGPDVVVEYELADAVARIYLNRPHRLNAVVPELAAGLAESIARAGRDGARVIVLAGRGRAFCSGHDLKQEVPPETVLATRRRVEQIQEVTRAIRRFPGPVIAAVHGYALGAGCEFALGCDLVVAAGDAQFGFPEVSVGLSVTGGISRLLPLLVGPVRAKEMLLLGDRFGADRALELGLVNRVAAAGQHEQAAAELAARLRDQSPLALALAKQALDRGAECALEEAMAAEVDFAALTVAPAAAGDER